MRPVNRQLFYSCSLLLLEVIAMVLAVCPKNALDKFQQCTTKVLPDLSQSSLSQGALDLKQTGSRDPAPYTNQVKDASESCRDSRLKDATDCIEDILDKCDGDSKEEQTLRRLVDKEKTLATVEYFCKNLRVYEQNAECIFRHHEEVNTCSQNAMKTFTSKINEGASMDVLMSASCRFHSTARTCLTKTTEIRCGQEAAQFVFQLLTGILPPHCSADDFDEQDPEYTPELGGKNPRYTPYGGGTKRNGDQGHYDDHNSASSAFPSKTMLSLLMCFIYVILIGLH